MTEEPTSAPAPAGIEEEDVEITGTYAYTWPQPPTTTAVVIYGDFAMRMGEFKLHSRDGVVWFRTQKWENRAYCQAEIFLWQDAEIHQPGGSVESGPALLVTLNTFGQIRLRPNGYVRQSDEKSALYQRATKLHESFEESGEKTEPDQTASVQVKKGAARKLTAFRPPKPPRRVDYSGHSLTSEMIDGRRVIVVIGDVRIAQAAGPSDEGMELQADSAVLYLSDKATGADLPGMPAEQGNKKKAPGNTAKKDEPPLRASEEPLVHGREKKGRQSAREFLAGAYLEGDVVLTRGLRMIRAPRIYYDFENDRALMVDAVMRAMAPDRNVPIYVRAEQVRQLSTSEYAARRARITTSEFYTPHLALGSTRAFITDRTPRNERGDVIGIEAGTYKAYDTTMQFEGVPILYWPFSQGDFSRDTMALRGVKVGYNDNLGATFESRWYLFNLLGLQQPPGYDATLKLDYFTDRGPGVGIDLDYIRENYYGLVRSSFLYDRGTDDNLGHLRDGDPDTDTRGRILWRHRQYLPNDWQLTLETSYLSDDQYLEAFERREWENGKDQETVLYLLKRRDNWQFSTLFNWRLNDFLELTEHFPDVKFSLIGEPITPWTNLYSESRLGVTRYRPDNRRLFDSDEERLDNTGRTDAVSRADTREELTVPLPELGPIKLTPYVAGRASAWDDSPHGPGRGRLFGAAGLRANMYLERTDDTVESDLLDLHRMRHIIKPDVTVWGGGSSIDSDKLSPFDQDVEHIDDFSGATIGLRQRFQTKRGGPGRWRTVDWITWDVEAGFFTNNRSGDRTHGDFIYSRPEDSISSNFLATQFAYRLSDQTTLIYDGVIDLNRGNAGTSSISLNVERDPRLAYFVGWRYIHDTDNNLFGFGANYKMNEKHTLAFREYYDIEMNRNYSTEVTLVRRWPRWYTALSLNWDRTINDFGVNLSIWPEGAPNLGLGSKRFTGLGDAIGLRP